MRRQHYDAKSIENDNINVQQSLYKCAQALRVPEEPVSQISRQLACEGGKVISRTHRPQGQSAVIRIISMKNSNDTVENRTRDLPACGTVPQPTAPPRYDNKVPKLDQLNTHSFWWESVCLSRNITVFVTTTIYHRRPMNDSNYQKKKNPSGNLFPAALWPWARPRL